MCNDTSRRAVIGYIAELCQFKKGAITLKLAEIPVWNFDKPVEYIIIYCIFKHVFYIHVV
jgi:hypothetical protein